MDNPIVANEPDIIFIGGTGRSGTNISKAIFTNHPQVATLPFEYRFIIDPDGIVDFYRSYAAIWSPYLADRRLKRLECLLNTLIEDPPLHKLLGSFLRILNRDGKVFSPRRYHGWQLNTHLPHFKQYAQELMAELREFSFSACWVGTESYTYHPQVYHAGPMPQNELAQILGGFICKVIGALLTHHQKNFYVEDNTWNVLFARELVELVPKAKILHVYRDPRDVVASFVQQRWCPSDKRHAALWYKSIMTHWFNVREKLPSECYYEYSLENLVSSTEQTMKEICQFTNIPYDPILLTLDLGQSHSKRWKQEFTIEEQQVVQDILGDIVHQLGYE